MTFHSPVIYGKTARFDSARALDEDELHSLAPSIFATVAHESRSASFKPIATIEVLRGLMTEGFMPVGARQSVARDESRRSFAKHLIRLRRIDDDAKFRVGDVVTEIILKNANDGTSGYNLMAGLFRIRCLNSLVAQTGTLDQVNVWHLGGNVRDKVIEGTYRVMEKARAALEAPQAWSQIPLDTGERQAFAMAAHELRFDDPQATPIKPDQFLHARRSDDMGRDLWTTFNVVQENAIRGGLTGYKVDERNRRHRVSTREIKGIDQDVKLNKALWTLASEMAKLKAA